MTRTISSLRERMSARFPIRSFDICVDGETYTLTTANDIEELISGITEEEFKTDERLPYWAELWHSAFALTEFVQAHAAEMHGKSVVELGCGLGLPGVATVRAGADVTFTDFDIDALTAAELNFRQNCTDADASFLMLDFRRPPDRRWDVMLAADVIYETRFIDPLALCIDRCLSESGTLYLAEPNRMVAVPFFGRLTELGFTYERSSIPTTLHGRTVDISLYSITRRLPLHAA